MRKKHRWGKRHHVDHKFPEIRAQLAREAQTGCDARHNNRYKMVKITISWSGKLQSAQVGDTKCLIFNAKCFIRVLHELVNRKHSIIGFNDCVRNLGTRDNEICADYAIGVLLVNFQNEKGTHASTSTTSEGVSDLETLEGICTLLLLNNIKDSIDEFGTFHVVALRPVVTCSTASALSKHKSCWGGNAHQEDLNKQHPWFQA